MSEYKIDCYSFSNGGSRNEVRMRLVEILSKERPGTADDTSRYTYFVEKLKDGNRIFLRRPANLHYGFDFIVCVENTNYAMPGKRRRNFPKHDDITADLEIKKKENPIEYKHLYDLLEKVYKCHDIDDHEIDAIHFNKGLPIDHIVKVIKWLFIEQDIRYWNYSGRWMTWGIVPSP